MKVCAACNAKYDDQVSFCANDGEVLEDDPTSLVGSVLDGQYQIEALLGKGGMGAVYRARHILLGDRVAVKVLPPQMRNNAEWLRRFRREGQAARRFRHPNAVTVYDLRTTAEGVIYMVMEYVEGHTLDVEMKSRGSFSPVEASQVLEPVMGVLNAAHATGVIHRDLKPENIMIGQPVDGKAVVKLLDLGIAKIQDIAGSPTTAATNLTVAGQMLGTPYYMSPEQWGEPSRDGGVDVDARTDIYSLGAVFYELIAGRRPFGARTLQDLRREHVFKTPVPLHELFPEVPEAFSRSVARAMSKDRADRPSTAGEFEEELRSSLPRAGVDSNSNSDLPLQRTTLGFEDASGFQTIGLPENRRTDSDINAATIVGDVPSPTSGGRSKSSTPASAFTMEPALPVEPPSVAANIGLELERDKPPLQARAALPAPTARKTKTKSVVLIVGAILSAFVILVGIVGVILWRQYGLGKAAPANAKMPPSVASSKPRSEDSKPPLAAKPSLDTQPAPGDTAAREVLRSWIEVDDKSSGDLSKHFVNSLVLKSGQSFRFHVLTPQDGYLYILGPGKDNKLYAFLTAKPVPMSGLKTNKVTAGSDFDFPRGDGNWITLDNKPGAEKYIFIFSRVALMEPSFLTDTANKGPISQTGEKEIEALRGKITTASVSTGAETGGGPPFISIKAIDQGGADSPVVFDLSIDHR